MKYEELLKQTNQHLSNLKSEYKLAPSESSWVFEAIKTVEKLIIARNNKVPQDKYFQQDEYLYDRTITSFSELTNLNGILKPINKINQNSINVFLNKLKKVFNAPLLMKDENSNSSEGRNTMFELRLFTKLVGLDFNVNLPLDQHPDILVSVGGNTYFIECKRIFQKETFIANIQNAIDQLNKYSLKNQFGYGIVALSITRYFHSGDKKLEATTERAMKTRIEVEMDRLVAENKDDIFSRFSLKIPALLLDFSDRAVADKAYCVNLIDLIETANGRSSLFYKVKKDFSTLTNQTRI